MKPRSLLTALFVGLTALLSTQTKLLADPLPGEVLKFSQVPQINTQIFDPSTGAIQTYYGHDELSTANANFLPGAIVPSSYSGTFMADDFSDKVSTPVVHLSWWGSYMNTPVPGNRSVQKFLIAFESDVPANPAAGTFSTPGQVLSSQIVTAGALAPASGTFTEAIVPNSSAAEPVFKYNAELAVPFPEQANTVYWLKIVALDDAPPSIQPRITWGWHDRDYTTQDLLASPVPVPGENIEGLVANTPVWHFQDDAVQGAITYDPSVSLNFGIRQSNMLPQDYIDNVDGPGSNTAGVVGIGNYSKDLAFQLFTTGVSPEPASLALLMLGVPALLRRRRH